jgi:glucokinase
MLASFRFERGPHMSTDLALAIDVGGTTIKGELVDASGAVHAARAAQTPRGAQARDAVTRVGCDLLADVTDGPVTGAGVVVPGLVETAAGVAKYSANIGWRDLELVDSLGAEWGVPVRIGNDVASGGVAEHRTGAGRGVDDMVFVPIGTGIAAALVSGGHLLTGHRGEIAELGHVVVRPGFPCGCGGDGCLEAVASAGAVARRYAELVDEPVAGSLEVAQRLDSDPAARQVWGDAVDALADAFTVVSALLSPVVVVVGGGLAESGELLLAPLRQAMADRARVVEPPTLATAAHGPRAGVVGAAMLAFDGWSQES